ncbi:MAG: hypothetical protein KGZ83_13375 [Sulfuricella sp.]|nr:hypothetical protein [Sulfuricella sp.]
MFRFLFLCLALLGSSLTAAGESSPCCSVIEKELSPYIGRSSASAINAVKKMGLNYAKQDIWHLHTHPNSEFHTFYACYVFRRTEKEYIEPAYVHVEVSTTSRRVKSIECEDFNPKEKMTYPPKPITSAEISDQ